MDSGTRGNPYKITGKKNGEIINPISPKAENIRKTLSVKYRSEKCISKALIMRKIWVISNINRNVSNIYNHFVIKYCPAKTFESFLCNE
jgi:hypothetical protein